MKANHCNFLSFKTLKDYKDPLVLYTTESWVVTLLNIAVKLVLDGLEIQITTKRWPANKSA